MENNNYENLNKPKLISEDIRRISKKVAIAFIVITIIIMISGTIIYGMQKEAIEAALSEVMKNFSELINEEGKINTVGLIINNIRVCFLAVIFGIVPFVYLPALLIPFNAAIIAVILVAISEAGISNMITVFILGILPHGILELPAIFLAIASGIWLCKVITHKILGKNPDVKLGDELIKILKVLFFVCVPLMIVAGIIETTLTPFLLGQFFI